ncbi:MAG: DUF1566 domain-containing protein [Rhodocyclaceae bacterium]|nr:DUF1566 domain-containing protein [Rhodocyclaceae bacterium]MBP7080868.1 DUF1566 domain-containing protein [Rhodocyclaceae bacterium]
MRTLKLITRYTSTLAILLAAVGMTPTHAADRFTPSADGQEVTDTTTGLIWRRCTEGMEWNGSACKMKPLKFKLAAAKERAAEAAKTSNKAWRIPNKDELMSIVEKTKSIPKIDLTAFPNSPSAVFWALRPDADDNLNAWLVNFNTGRVLGNSGQNKFMLRLVRSGP